MNFSDIKAGMVLKCLDCEGHGSYRSVKVLRKDTIYKRIEDNFYFVTFEYWDKDSEEYKIEARPPSYFRPFEETEC
jgi:hypothetical protein